ncbi:MAG: sigma-E processing peptidase SpoIIGA [Clostridia bacterium]|nr:sigma-E processing peptidase SpoIIGA [Clostridia bacterium]
MVVYIEYALLENVLFDGILLFLSLSAANACISRRKLIFASLCGGVFAVVFPLLVLPPIFAYILKFSFGFLLCFIPFGRIKTKNEWGRYALSATFFFIFSFGFGGALLGLSQRFTAQKLPAFPVMIGFLLLAIGSMFLVRKLHAKRAISRVLYDCVIEASGKKLSVCGFLDSGNLARFQNLPVCFVSPDIVYELWGEEIVKGEGQVCDEMTISTLGGEKTLSVYKGQIQVEINGKKLQKRAYFAPSTNILSREYKMIINAYLWDEG